MKKFFTVIVLLSFASTFTFSQVKVKERDVKGEWQMVIDIDFDKVEEDIEEDSWFGAVIAGAMSGMVEDVMEEIDIRMKFMDEGRLKITVIAFGEEEIEYGEWYINRDGQLVIIDEDDHREDDDVWMKQGEDLVSYEQTASGRLKRQEVFLRRL